MAFFCNDCHLHVCPGGNHAHFLSHGVCEICGCAADCVECSIYDARKMTDEDRVCIRNKRQKFEERFEDG